MSEKNLPAAQLKNGNIRLLRDLLAKSKEQIAMALPKHLTPERLIRVALTTVQRVPGLAECDPKSVVGAIVEAAQLGLEPDNILGHAYLVPFKNQCRLIAGYKGLVDLCRRSGQISTIYAHVVREKDKYKLEYGLHPKLVHIPAQDENAGDLIAAYAVAHLRDGGVQFVWLWRREIDAIRARSRAAKEGPWVTDYEEMCKKTALRRLVKLLPVSVETQRIVAKEELIEAGVDLPTEGAVEVAQSLTATEALAGKLLRGKAEADAAEVEQSAQEPQEAIA